MESTTVYTLSIFSPHDGLNHGPHPVHVSNGLLNDQGFATIEGKMMLNLYPIGFVHSKSPNEPPSWLIVAAIASHRVEECHNEPPSRRPFEVGATANARVTQSLAMATRSSNPRVQSFAIRMRRKNDEAPSWLTVAAITSSRQFYALFIPTHITDARHPQTPGRSSSRILAPPLSGLPTPPHSSPQARHTTTVGFSSGMHKLSVMRGAIK